MVLVCNAFYAFFSICKFFLSVFILQPTYNCVYCILGSIMDKCEPFLSPIDDSHYIQSDLKKIVASISKKKLKQMILCEHRRTMILKRLDSNDQMSFAAMTRSMEDNMSAQDIYQFLVVYQQICQQLSLVVLCFLLYYFVFFLLFQFADRSVSAKIFRMYFPLSVIVLLCFFCVDICVLDE